MLKELLKDLRLNPEELMPSLTFLGVDRVEVSFISQPCLGVLPASTAYQKSKGGIDPSIMSCGSATQAIGLVIG